MGRLTTEAFTQALVTKYNATHENKVKLTAIPDDQYLPKVGAAAGSKSLPDILASDVVYTPNYTKQGLFKDISADIKALPFANALAKSHLDVASYKGKTYAVPHKLDSSVMFYNKDLYRKAGLDPEKPPPTSPRCSRTPARSTRSAATSRDSTSPATAAAAGSTPFPVRVGRRQGLLEDGTKFDFDNDASQDLRPVQADDRREPGAHDHRPRTGRPGRRSSSPGRSASCRSARRSSAC